MITGPKHVRCVCDHQPLFCSVACSMTIMLHLWFLQKILQNSPPVGAARADPVEGVDSPHRVVGNNFVHRVSVDNSLFPAKHAAGLCPLDNSASWFPAANVAWPLGWDFPSKLYV